MMPPNAFVGAMVSDLGLILLETFVLQRMLFSAYFFFKNSSKLVLKFSTVHRTTAHHRTTSKLSSYRLCINQYR